MLIENIHFLRTKITPRDLGYKSLAVNLSDIAAMGGSPESAFLSLGLPADIDIEWLDDFFAGLHELAEREGIHVLGGDTAKSPTHLMINISVLGKANPRFIKYRSAAKQGDMICVTDYLGDSGGGLKILLENRDLDVEAEYLIRKHNRPCAHLAEGTWLASQTGVHAMMDISDGIDSDLRRIMEQSLCGAQIIIEQVPLSPELQRTSGRYGWDTTGIAVGGGEDYCLLATIDTEQYSRIAQEFETKFKRPLTNIGIVTTEKSGLQYIQHRRQIILQKHGYDHFT